jgi:hypothetical protein
VFQGQFDFIFHDDERKSEKKKKKKGKFTRSGGGGAIEKNIVKNLSLTRRCFLLIQATPFIVKHANISEPLLFFWLCGLSYKKVLASQMRTVNYLSRVTCTNIYLSHRGRCRMCTHNINSQSDDVTEQNIYIRSLCFGTHSNNNHHHHMLLLSRSKHTFCCCSVLIQSFGILNLF